MALPPDWLLAELSDNFMESFDELAADNESLEGAREQIQALIDQGVEFVAYDISIDGIGRTVTRNIFIVRESLPFVVSAESLAEVSAQNISDVYGEDVEIRQDAVNLPAGDAARLHIDLPIDYEGTEVVVHQDQYYVLADDYLYLINFTTDKERETQDESLFLQIAQTFRVAEDQ